MARVLVGVSGGISAYKACELVRLFVKGGHDVVPLVTPAAERFVRAQMSQGASVADAHRLLAERAETGEPLSTAPARSAARVPFREGRPAV